MSSRLKTIFTLFSAGKQPDASLSDFQAKSALESKWCFSGSGKVLKSQNAAVAKDYSP